MFFRTLRSYVVMFKPDNIYCVWDKRLLHPSTNFRKESIEYKTQRDRSEMEEIHKHDELITQMMSSLGIRVMYPRVMEGDDVIAWLSHNLEGKKTIVSVDFDFLQLVTEDINIFSPIRKILIEPANLQKITIVDPKHFILYKAIMGDVGDNIMGLDGFGKVKSKKLAESWEENKHKLTEEEMKTVELNKTIVDLSYGYTVYPEEVESYKIQLEEQSKVKADFKVFKQYCINDGLYEITDNFTDWISPFRKDNLMVNYITDIKKQLNLA